MVLTVACAVQTEQGKEVRKLSRWDGVEEKGVSRTQLVQRCAQVLTAYRRRGALDCLGNFIVGPDDLMNYCGICLDPS